MRYSKKVCIYVYSDDHINKKVRLAGHVARMGKGRGACRVLLGKRKGMRTFGRVRRRLGDNTKMDLNKPVRRAWTGLIWLL